MLDLAFILVLAAHLLAMNVATAGPLVCLWLKRREVRLADAEAGRLGVFLAWWSIHALLIGMALGAVATGLLWLSGEERFFQALAIVPRRRLWFGAVELIFFLALMSWYAWAWRSVRRSTLWHPTLAILAATDLIYHFPPLFAVLAVLQGRPALPTEELSYAGFLALMYAPETLARLLHFLLASIAVTGALILIVVYRQGKEPLSERWIAWSGRLALAPSLLQLLAGVYLLFKLPASQQQRLMGGDWLATGLFATSGVAAFALLHSLSALALGETSRREIARSVWLMAFVVLAMTAARHVA